MYLQVYPLHKTKSRMMESHFTTIESKENFNNHQHATIENFEGHINFQWNGSILLMFHSRLHIHHGTHHQITMENLNH